MTTWFKDTDNWKTSMNGWATNIDTILASLDFSNDITNINTSITTINNDLEAMNEVINEFTIDLSDFIVQTDSNTTSITSINNRLNTITTSPINYTPIDDTIEGNLEGIDGALGTLFSLMKLPSIEDFSGAGPHSINTTRNITFVRMTAMPALGGASLQLPISNLSTGKLIIIFDYSNSVSLLNVLTIEGNGNNIDGNVSTSITAARGFVVLYWDSSEWKTVIRN